jgi:hypothetical protein
LPITGTGLKGTPVQTLPWQSDEPGGTGTGLKGTPVQPLPKQLAVPGGTGIGSLGAVANGLGSTAGTGFWARAEELRATPIPRAIRSFFV